MTDMILDPEVAAAAEGAAAPEDVDIVSTVGRESLRCVLTPEETNGLKDQLVLSIQELERLELDLKSIKSSFKKDMDAKTAIIKNLTSKLSNGYEYKPVEVTIIKNYLNKSVTVVRTDTGETIRSRNMTIDEIQRSLLPPELPPEDHPAAPTAEGAAE